MAAEYLGKALEKNNVRLNDLVIYMNINVVIFDTDAH
jgi:hypothetical protein